MATAAITNVSSFGVENYLGPLFGLYPTEHPFLTMIGGIGGSNTRPVRSREFPWSDYDNKDPSQPGHLEAVTPTYEMRGRVERKNVVQIFKYGVELSYTKMAVVDQLASDAASVLGDQPVQDEMSWQLMRKLEQAGRDVNWTFHNGEFNNPTDNTTARKTKGMFNALTTNVVDVWGAEVTATFAAATDLWSATGHGLVAGDQVVFTTVGTGATNAGAVVFPKLKVFYVIATGLTANDFALSATKGGAAILGDANSAGTWKYRKLADLSKSHFDELFRKMFAAGAKFRTPVGFCGAYGKQRVSAIYGFAPESRTVGGLNIRTVNSDLIDELPVTVDRDIYPFVFGVYDISWIRPAALAIPGKGLFFTEPKPADGDSEKQMLYGEIGLEYGTEQWHGLIRGIKVEP